jgi:hypothetical protein
LGRLVPIALIAWALGYTERTIYLELARASAKIEADPDSAELVEEFEHLRTTRDGRGS